MVTGLESEVAVITSCDPRQLVFEFNLWTAKHTDHEILSVTGSNTAVHNGGNAIGTEYMLTLWFRKVR